MTFSELRKAARHAAHHKADVIMLGDAEWDAIEEYQRQRHDLMALSEMSICGLRIIWVSAPTMCSAYRTRKFKWEPCPTSTN